MLVDVIAARISSKDSAEFREQPNEYVDSANSANWVNKIYGIDDTNSNFGDMFDRASIENMNRDVRKLKGVSVSLDNNYAVLGSIGAKLTAAVPYVTVAAIVAGIGYSLWNWADPVWRANKALEKTNDSPTILLAHQPKYIKELETTKGIDLILCGHTHGGQIFPFNFLVKFEQPYVKGLHTHNEFTQVYVNKGTGFWGPPMRLGASSEITILKLNS